MTWNVLIAEAAENDLRDAFLWYEMQTANLGLKFEDQFNRALDSVKSNPLKAQIRYNNIRVFFLRKFPYGVHYVIHEDKKEVVIVAVFHTAQNSNRWERVG